MDDDLRDDQASPRADPSAPVPEEPTPAWPPPAAAPPAPPPVSFGAVPALLSATAPWARFLSIVGFISVGMMIVVGVSAGAMGLATGRPETAVLMVIYPLFGLIYFFPSLYLLQFAKRSRGFARGGQTLVELEAALDAQRRFWKFAGIVTVIGLVLSMLLFAAVVLFSLIARTADV